MKNSWVTKSADEFTGMRSSEPPDRIDVKQSALLVNGYVDRTGRVRKQKGVSLVSTGASLRLTASSPRTSIRSGHLYQGRNGQTPDSRVVIVAGSNILRSKANDLMSAFDPIAFPATMPTPTLDKAAAGVFRQRHFYHQNGVDFPFRIECETDDGSAPSLTAEPVGLIPPAYCAGLIAANGAGTRFPIGKPVGYCMTFVYGDRGESGPSPVQYVIDAAATDAKFDLRNPQPAPAGVTARRFYRTLIGRARVTASGTSLGTDVAEWEKPAQSQEMFLLYEDTERTLTSFSDDKDDSSLVLTETVPPPRPFPPIAKYAVFHLDRIFWSNVREHPWVAQIVSPTKYAGNTITTASITISNTGNGTISLAANDGTPRTLTVSNYKTKSLAAVEKEINVGYTIFDGTAGGDGPTFTRWVFKISAGIDTSRTYTFQEVTAQPIAYTDGPYQIIAIDDVTTEGLRWFPAQTWFSEITFPEQVDLSNSFDLSSKGSKKITGAAHSELDGSLVLFTEDKPFIVSGDFVPAVDTGVPVFRVDPAIAGTGNICYRPDAVCATDIGIFYVSHDGLRLFRGESSVPAGREVQNWFDRVLREPVARDQLSMCYSRGRLYVILPTDEVAP